MAARGGKRSKRRVPASARTPKPPKTKNGNRNLYCDEYAEQAALLAANGATDLEIASFFKIARRTFYRWAATNAPFQKALAKGREEGEKARNDRVERSLLERATGFVVDTEKVVIDPKTGMVSRAKTKEYVPPDVNAATKWLASRDRERWGQSPETPINVTIQNNVQSTLVRLQTMSESERLRRVAAMLVDAKDKLRLPAPAGEVIDVVPVVMGNGNDQV